VRASSEQARALRTAHVAIAVAFVAFGTVDGTWVARLPAIKDNLGLDSVELGLVILAVSLSATVLLTGSGWFSSRYGGPGPTLLGLLVVAAALTATAFAPSFAALLPAAGLIGVGFGIVDVAANAHGIAIERRLGRPVLSALHGAWSLGLLVGSGIAAVAAAAAIGVRVQFSAVAFGFVFAGSCSRRGCCRAGRTRPSTLPISRGRAERSRCPRS
jgi:MFS family permease